MNGIKTTPTDKPCQVCGKPIQPGQLYLPRFGPRHIWCKFVGKVRRQT